MQKQHDPIESALQSLGNERWPGSDHRHELEEKLMREFDNKNTTSRIRRHPLLAACLAVLVLGSFGFAAAGGIEMVRNWFVTIEVNGEVVATQTVVPDENGNAEFDIPPIEIEGDESAMVTITTDGPAPADGEGVQRTVNVTLGEDGGRVQVLQEEVEEDED